MSFLVPFFCRSLAILADGSGFRRPFRTPDVGGALRGSLTARQGRVATLPTVADRPQRKRLRLMVRLVRIDDSKTIGYLDDPKCRGPLEPGKLVEFDVWSRDRECFPEDPGPACGVAYPKKVQHDVFSLEVRKIDHEVCLMIQSYDEDYFRKCSDFRPA
jgi:hypothetical protein